MDALDIAAAVGAGEVAATEVCDAAIEQIEARNSTVNAVVIPLFEEARRAAATATGPFAGVPIVLKDLGACLAGLPLYQGNQLLRRLDWRAFDSAPLAERLSAAGFVIVGKTNTPEFGAGADTQPKSFGPTTNPWNSDYSASGSSGGSAAAVAAGLVSIAHGSDFGGSIRMPAAWCGVIGLKPSRGRISTHPAPPGANTEFVITSSLRDAAAVLDAVADPDAPAAGAPPPEGWLRTHTYPPPRVRIGLISGVAGVSTEADTVRPAREAAAVLADAGHDVIELSDGFLADAQWDQMQLVVRAKGAAARLDALADIAGRPLDEDDVEPLMLALADLAPSVTEREHAGAVAWQLRYAARLSDRWREQRLGAVITPTTGITPRPLVDMRPPPHDPIRIYDTYRRTGCFAGCWNMTGSPAISMPWWSPATDRLPRAVQLVAAPGGEDLVLRLAHQLVERRPDLAAVRHPDGPQAL